MSEADVHVPEKRRRNAEANQDHLQNKDQNNSAALMVLL